ncbi:DNA-binding transcriptional regulator, XRE-family HTH domain [Actinopolyspora alba]|uniref:DNA-binding transcriptional regulator, XRE-family HTH domain n=1 Tax=Actinopolyspora alba TaxID=673379 RepID=A0A1I2BI94_9ACTN|nr:helix-turn-helix transcriptional regulator [Actinopolyspora alba]SFE55548.1 DNA-binding transcriptional regulator, XRE-family HTH domain [Actinopolyspora alba]
MPKAGPRLRQVRYELDLSAADVAAQVRITEGAVRNVENGSTKASMRLLHRFARLYGVPVDELIAIGSDEGPDRPPGHPPGPRRPEPSRPPRDETAVSA